MAGIRLYFQRGGSLTVCLNDQTPHTVRQVLNALPYENYVMHTRYCGREICFGLATGPEKPPKENNTCMVSKFDVSYWRDWQNPQAEALPGSPGTEGLSIYYGPEHLSFQGQVLPANVIGHVAWDEEQQLEEIGLRIWQQGFENVRAERI